MSEYISVYNLLLWYFQQRNNRLYRSGYIMVVYLNNRFINTISYYKYLTFLNDFLNSFHKK